MMRSTTSLDDKEETDPASRDALPASETKEESDGKEELQSFYATMPPGYSLFASTNPFWNSSTDKKTAEEIGVGFDETESCDMIDMLDIRFQDKAYHRDQVDILMRKMVERNGYTFKYLYKNSHRNIYAVYEHNETGNTIALFPVVKDRDDSIFQNDKSIYSLSDVFDLHRSNKERNDKIIVPIATSIMPHYRLLTLDLNKHLGLYHDSKSAIASSSTELARAVLSAATTQLLQNVKTNIDVNPLLLPGFLDSWNYVYANCERYFYNIGVAENCMNHQEFYSEVDTGAYIVAYTDLFLQGQDLQIPFTLDINQRKEEFHQLLFSKVPETAVTPSSLRIAFR